jgi:hypothetical protein
VGLLSLPVAFAGRVRWAERLSGEMELALAGGLVQTRMAMTGRTPVLSLRLATLPWFQLRRKPGDPPAGKRKVKNKQVKKRHLSWSKGKELLLNSQAWQRAISYARSVYKSLRLNLRLEGEYGTEDPALTGWLSALVGVLAGGPLELDLCPVFDGPCLDIRGELHGRLIPAKILWLTGGFLLTRPVRQLWWPKTGKRRSKLQRRS